MGCGALAMRSGLPTASSKISSVCLETSIPTQRRGKITGPVPVMRGLLAQPRATVQVDGRNGRAGDRAGSRRHAPGTQRLPAHLIMTDPAYTGTHNHRRQMMYRAAAAHRVGKPPVVMGPGLRRDDRQTSGRNAHFRYTGAQPNKNG